jgi:hypothetical protein
MRKTMDPHAVLRSSSIIQPLAVANLRPDEAPATHFESMV